MITTLSAATQKKVTSFLRAPIAEIDRGYPGDLGRRQPIHTVYGGANLFKSGTAKRLGQLAIQSFESFAPDADTFANALSLPSNLAQTIFERVGKKLESEAVEDFRIDFEDGYGVRSDAEEDGHAVFAAEQCVIGLQADSLPPFVGIRIKALNQETQERAIRTLDLFLTKLVRTSKGRLPDNFVVTLPKVVTPFQVGALADLLDEIEAGLGLDAGSIKMEIMIETTQALITADGTAGLPKILEAARGRCTGAHFGAYDYTSSCNITAQYQDLAHPLCDFARTIMQVSLAGTGVWLSDGATNFIPTAIHRGENISAEQIGENRLIVYRAWKRHYDDCRHSLANGFYQGWDLHPAQLPTRYAAIYAFFLEGLNEASERLCNFVDKAARATLVGDVFDDAATGQGLLNYFLRAINCGAVSEKETFDLTGITLDELNSGSFVKIIENRKSQSDK